jgi:hypothetical protein
LKGRPYKILLLKLFDGIRLAVQRVPTYQKGFPHTRRWNFTAELWE